MRVAGKKHKGEFKKKQEESSGSFVEVALGVSTGIDAAHDRAGRARTTGNGHAIDRRRYECPDP